MESLVVDNKRLTKVVNYVIAVLSPCNIDHLSRKEISVCLIVISRFVNLLADEHGQVSNFDYVISAAMLAF